MKKCFLAVIITLLIAGNIFLLVLMQNGFDFKTMKFIETTVTPSDISTVSATDVSSADLSNSTSSDATESRTEDIKSLDYGELKVSLDSLDGLKSNESCYAANACNGGYVAEYKDALYYTDVNNSNHLYYSQNDLKTFTARNNLDSWCINVSKDKIYYVNRDDGCIYSLPVKYDSDDKLDKINKKLGDKPAVCLVADEKYLYYISSTDDDSSCGEIRQMELNGKNDKKISPDGYMCENIIPCGDFILFVAENSGERKICALEIKSLKVTEIYEGNVSDINYIDGKLWFIYHSAIADGICFVESDSTNINCVFSIANINNLIVEKDYIYYMTRSGYAKCFRMSAEGGKPDMVYDSQKAEMQFFNVADGYIYFGANSGKYMRRISPDDNYVTIMIGSKK